MSIGRLVAFALLAAFAAAHWATLVTSPPLGRLALVVAAAVGAAASLEAIDRAPMPRRRAWLLSAATGLVVTALALAAIGIGPRLLWPAGWEELGAGVDHGLAGLAGSIDYPYSGENEWSRLLILTLAPVALTVAALLAFWPAGGSSARPPRAPRVWGLIILVALYVGAAAANPAGAALPRGLVLLALLAGWLWLPTIRRREALAAGAMVGAAGALALPAAAALGGSEPWLDYRSWKLRGGEGTTYRWEHSYGPIDWPRDGTQMLSVHSPVPHYWKAVVLDRFDGLRWRRSYERGGRDISGGIEPTALPPEAAGESRWLKRFRVTIGDLESDVVIGAGTPVEVEGTGPLSAAADGTTVLREESLGRGDSYWVTAYVPDPTAREMRAAPVAYAGHLARYTRIELPGAVHASSPLTVPLYGHGPDESVSAELAASPYAEVQRLARRLVAGRRSVYGAVRAIEEHLRDSYAYGERPPRRRYPLAAFLSRDRTGYCQQFSGAMALMLRTVGIPSRVVSGFAPGTRAAGGGPFGVEDLDAHAWVEVYFNEIGWVAFDPTPAAAPASSRPIPGPGDGAVPEQLGPGEAPAESAPDAAVGGGPDSGSSGPTAVLAAPAALALALGLALAAVGRRTLRHRGLAPAVAAQAQLLELGVALERLGLRTAAGATLLELEHRLRLARRPAASRYVARLRAIRYAPEGGRPPTLAERRALRRELSSLPGGRWRALIAIPPGGPRLERGA